MYFKKEGYPEEHEIVLCTVESITPNSIFVTLDDYGNKEGLIHISEIAPGRIRNIREYVKEKHKIVGIVLQVSKERHLIDLSLRRVSLQNKMAVEEWHKQEMIAEKLLDNFARSLKHEGKELYTSLGKILIAKYGSLFKAFQQIAVEGEKALEGLGIDNKLEKPLIQTIQDRIKKPEVKIEALINIKNAEAEGIEQIKTTLKNVEDYMKKAKAKVQFHYLGAPYFKTTIHAADFKSAEKILEKVSMYMQQEAKKTKSEAIITREKEK
ncbi:MAG: S1 RNA-binding domain-containing protein [Nanoarchaeota archaeon]